MEGIEHFLGEATFRQCCDPNPTGGHAQPTGGHACCTGGHAGLEVSQQDMATPLESAQVELEDAGAHQREIDRLIVIEHKKLDAFAAERQNKGRGRPNGAHASKVKAAESRIARLQRGLLPSDDASVPNALRTKDELVGSAAGHPQHHAAASSVPVGRPSVAKRRRDQDGQDEGEISDGDGGDGEESADVKQYYRVSSAQQAFNNDVMHGYLKHDLLRSEIKVHPDNLVASGCKHELMGLGAIHICAPHLHMGLPMTPCPRHGWESIDHPDPY